MSNVAKYEVGDQVLVREDLMEGGMFQVYVSEEMASYAGKTVYISAVFDEEDKEFPTYQIEEDNGFWCWSEDLFYENLEIYLPDEKELLNCLNALLN